jgi:hypothetical protein
MASASQIDMYNARIAQEAAKLTGALAAIRADEAAGTLTIRESADARIAVMELHLAALRQLREELDAQP